MISSSELQTIKSISTRNYSVALKQDTQQQWHVSVINLETKCEYQFATYFHDYNIASYHFDLVLGIFERGEYDA